MRGLDDRERHILRVAPEGDSSCRANPGLRVDPTVGGGESFSPEYQAALDRLIARGAVEAVACPDCKMHHVATTARGKEVRGLDELARRPPESLVGGIDG